MADRECVCGHRYVNNCAHFLANWMIVERRLSGVEHAGGAYCCTAGRPIRAKEMASVDAREGVFEKVLGLRKHLNPPPGDANCYIYCEKSGQGHVYYGTRDRCEAGTGSGAEFGMTYFQYYY